MFNLKSLTMWWNVIKKVLVCTFLFLGLQSNAQLVRSAYFLDNLPTRTDFNPAFQPINESFKSIPLLGTWQGSTWSDIQTFKQLGFTPGQTVDLNDLNNPFFVNQNSQISFFSQNKMKLYEFGFRANRAFWTFSLGVRSDNQFVVPRDGLRFYSLMSEENLNTSIDFSGANISSKIYTELSVAYSRYFSENLSIGLKAKYLLGNGYYDFSLNSFGFESTENGIKAVGNADFKYAASYYNPDSMSINSYSQFFTKPQGMGGAIDLGVAYKPFKGLMLSASLLDLGWLGWQNVQNANYNLDMVVDYQYMMDNPYSKTVELNSLTDDTGSAYLTPKYTLGAEYQLIGNLMTVGVLSQGMYLNKNLEHELTASLNFKPVNWFNFALTYSAIHGKASNFGAGVGLRMKKLHFFVAADYLPVNTVKSLYNGNMSFIKGQSLPLPFNSDRVNFAVGFNYVLGLRKDADKDGVSDPNDKCMYTPAGVRVDKYGCPLDTDKDGVPDYLDRCEDTPDQALGYLTEYGCPIDSDGDNVPDFMDVCPDNPQEANSTVDSNGCPKDTDADGVFDYLDKCPDTPGTARVDSNGCPLDNDADGVPDYKDLCPDTPVAAKDLVDINGCPIDSDDDGVLDYLDLCPDTPFDARGYTDKSGCLKDSDDDGIPDFKDECNNTPFESREMVDDKGCSLDSDFDGVPDYKDICPKVVGKESNLGCPDNFVEPQPERIDSIQIEKQKTEAPVEEPLQNNKI